MAGQLVEIYILLESMTFREMQFFTLPGEIGFFFSQNYCQYFLFTVPTFSTVQRM